jgi:hypothetical protein
MNQPQQLSGLALALVAASAGLILLASGGWSGACAQGRPAPTGHRQPTATDAPSESSQKQAPRSPEDIALDRALNNVCRGCSPTVPVGDVPRYDIARRCRGTSEAGDEVCRKDEETARASLKEQWNQFTSAARSNCIQTTGIGGSKPSYVHLLICLAATRIAPTLPEGR